MNTRTAWLSPLFGLTLLIACTGDDDTPSVGDRDAGMPPAPMERLTDPLSMPMEPSLDPEGFMGAQACAACHPTQYEQWSGSMHAYAMVDPVYRKLVEARQRDYDGQQDAFCTQCHSAIATRGGEITPGFDFDDLSEIALEGVTCESCHRVQSIERDYNSGHVLDPSGPIRGPLRDPMETSAHESEYAEYMDESRFCGGCHDVVEVSGMNLERAYQEWRESPAAEAGDNCQSCHMPSFDGSAAVGAPERTGLHAHSFVGVDVPLSEGFVDGERREALREQARGLLEGSVGLALQAQASLSVGAQLDLLVTVDNRVEGHSFPTGSTSLRQAWLELIATDAQGKELYRTGVLDDNGDLRDFFSELDPYGDQDLITFHSRLVDALGTPEIFPWRAVEHFTNAIPPGYDRTYTLFIPTADAAPGPLTIEARVRFRTHPPYLLRRLGLEELIERVETYDVATASTTVELQ